MAHRNGGGVDQRGSGRIWEDADWVGAVGRYRALRPTGWCGFKVGLGDDLKEAPLSRFRPPLVQRAYPRDYSVIRTVVKRGRLPQDACSVIRQLTEGTLGRWGEWVRLDANQ
jgi:hypothetical protein